MSAGMTWAADSLGSPAHAFLRAARDAQELTPAQADVFLSPSPSDELYFSHDEPDQLRNLAEDPEHAATVKTPGPR